MSILIVPRRGNEERKGHDGRADSKVSEVKLFVEAAVARHSQWVMLPLSVYL